MRLDLYFRRFDTHVVPGTPIAPSIFKVSRFCRVAAMPCFHLPRTALFRLVVACAALVTLSGCASSAVVTAMSLSASGVSLVTTGKSIPDHIVSTALEQDCSFFRTLQGQDVCRTPNAEPEILAAVEARETTESTFAVSESQVTAKPEVRAQEPAPVELAASALPAATDPPTLSPEPDSSTTRADTVSLLTPRGSVPAGSTPKASTPTGATAKVTPMAPDADEPGRVPARVVPRPAPRKRIDAPQMFAVVGSFASRGNAQSEARAVEGYRAFVVAADTQAGRRYRVVVSREDGSVPSLSAVRQAGYAEAWPIRLCGSESSPLPCDATQLLAQNLQ